MDARFSPRVKDVISYSREEALRLGHDYMGVEHLLLGIIREGEGMAIKIMKSLGVDISDLRKKIESSIKVSTSKSLNLNQIPLVKQAEKALKVTYLEARLFKTSLIGTEHLLLAILKDEDNIVTKTLENLLYELKKLGSLLKASYVSGTDNLVSSFLISDSKRSISSSDFFI